MSGLVPCPGCRDLRGALADLETRVAELERKAADICERCMNPDPVLRRCRSCERQLCLVCLGTDTCAHHQLGRHTFP